MTPEPFFDVCPARFTCKRMNKRMKSVNFEQRPPTVCPENPGGTLSLILVPIDVRSLPEDIRHHEWPDVQADSAVEIWVPAN